MTVRLMVVACFFLLAQCRPERATRDLYSSQLFHDVQTLPVFPDSKTFVDCTPKEDISVILDAYDQQRKQGEVDLKAFVTKYFDLPQRPQTNFHSDEQTTIDEHLKRLWPVLTRTPDQPVAGSSLHPLPQSYVVPGGRFSEVYYWDSYFTQLGLNIHGRTDLIRNMVDNFSYLLDTIGHIPNGNRAYYDSRSQPPFFSMMVRLLQEHDSTALVHYLPALEKEYAFWMKGADRLQNPGDTFQRVVVMSDGTLMNRYWDQLATPRPEAYKEDFKLKEETSRDTTIYRELRAAAESGWDFSTRWLADGKTLGTIHTTDIIPVDLNSLMLNLELTLAEAHGLAGNKEQQSLYKKRAASRRRCLLTFMWDVDQNFFMDYDFVKQKNTGIKSLAGMFPLFFKFIQADLAEKASQTIQNEFLQQGGVLATLTNSGQQWDAPNGWAPLQWVTYKGLRNYQLDPMAQTLRDRWLSLNERVYKRTGKMLEKYNVMDTTLLGGGGEYPNQDGFGWTNGIYLALKKEQLLEKGM